MTGWAEPVAIVGMAGRFPGAPDVGRFWTGLHGGIYSIRFGPDPEPGSSAGARVVRASAAADELDGFDAEFFGLSAEQASGCDPRALVLLECAHAALEDAGYDVEQTTEAGLFAGAGGSARYPVGPLGTAEPTALAARLLGLRGPSLGIQAGEASSLVAVHLACASLLAGESELALAGGVQLEPALGHGYRWEPGDELSRDGYCRPFDRIGDRHGARVRSRHRGVEAAVRRAGRPGPDLGGAAVHRGQQQRLDRGRCRPGRCGRAVGGASNGHCSWPASARPS